MRAVLETVDLHEQISTVYANLGTVTRTADCELQARTRLSRENEWNVLRAVFGVEATWGFSTWK